MDEIDGFGEEKLKTEDVCSTCDLFVSFEE